jgi:DNA-binding LytR/AlgR family response regulator
MQPINCLIIDDEPLARKGLKEYIQDIDFLRLEAECDTALKATQVLGEGRIQLLFLDIQLPKITGIEFFRSLRQVPPVIFTTAYPEHALEGFELNALDYLVKPISFERFLRAALKAKEYYEVRQHNLSERTEGDAKGNFFFVKADNKLVRIFFEEVLFVEALQNYVAIHTRERKLITYLTFSAVADYLPPDQFIRTHKSFIVAAARIDNIEGNEIRIGSHHIPISRGSREEVMEKLLKGRFWKR